MEHVQLIITTPPPPPPPKNIYCWQIRKKYFDVFFEMDEVCGCNPFLALFKYISHVCRVLRHSTTSVFNSKGCFIHIWLQVHFVGKITLSNLTCTQEWNSYKDISPIIIDDRSVGSIRLLETVCDVKQYKGSISFLTWYQVLSDFRSYQEHPGVGQVHVLV